MTFTMNERLKQFLLSLLNATLLLGIILAVTGIILISKVESFTASVISQVKFAALEDIDKDVKDVAAAIYAAERDLKTIASRLGEIVDKPDIVLSADLRQELHSLRDELQSLQKTAAALPEKTAQELSKRLDNAVGLSALPLAPDAKRELRELNRELGALQRALAALTSSHSRISDHAIRAIALAAANAYIGARRCRSAQENSARRTATVNNASAQHGLGNFFKLQAVEDYSRVQ